MLTADSPIELVEAIESELAGVSIPHLRSSVQALSEQYRNRDRSEGRPLSRQEAAAYVAYRMPATYASIRSVFREVGLVLPEWRPASFFDAGAGTGAGLWAAQAQWHSLEQALLLDQSQEMIDVGTRIAASLPRTDRVAFEWQRGRLGIDVGDESHNLVHLGYVMNELSPGDRMSILEWLWGQADGVLVIVEPGTPDGFESIRTARRWLIDQGAHIVAPCPHELPCPMDENDWCHFSVRLTRSRIHRDVKPGELAYEDEKFSYVAASRSPVARPTQRILRHPTYGRGFVRLTLCTDQGLNERTVTRRRDRPSYKAARSANWGESFAGVKVNRRTETGC